MLVRLTRLILTPLCLILSCSLLAQSKLLQLSGIRGDLQKVVADYPLSFATIRGEVINKNPQTTEYRSKVLIGETGQCTVVEYSADTKPVYSWQSLVFVSEDFEAAAKKYKWLYSQTKGANLYYLNDQYTLRGAYQEATESRNFAVSTLSLVSPPPAYKKLRVEIALQFEFPEWKVRLLVFEKEREDTDAVLGE